MTSPLYPGLGGDPNPVVSPARAAVLNEVAAAALSLLPSQLPILVAIDGRPGAGKSTFADELQQVLERDCPRQIIRSSTDVFHNDRAARYRRGKFEPESYYLDSHNISALVTELLLPMKSGQGQYRTAIFNEPLDELIEQQPADVDSQSILVFDGLFLHRPELRSYWDVSVFLDADRRYFAAAFDATDRGSIGGPSAIVQCLRWCFFARRYWEGWQLYAKTCRPENRATFVIDNNDLKHPLVLRRR